MPKVHKFDSYDETPHLDCIQGLKNSTDEYSSFLRKEHCIDTIFIKRIKKSRKPKIQNKTLICKKNISMEAIQYYAIFIDVKFRLYNDSEFLNRLSSMVFNKAFLLVVPNLLAVYHYKVNVFMLKSSLWQFIN